MLLSRSVRCAASFTAWLPVIRLGRVLFLTCCSLILYLSLSSRGRLSRPVSGDMRGFPCLYGPPCLIRGRSRGRDRGRSRGRIGRRRWPQLALHLTRHGGLSLALGKLCLDFLAA